MAKILLLEPNYIAKYPPLGLMKISYYHKFIRKDEFVFFAKGKIPHDSQYINTCWDKIYITTLFTFEWAETKKTIEYAKQLVGSDCSKIFIGGIAATLMPDEFEKETGIHPITGLLNEHGKAGFNDYGELDDAQIDSLPPDYSILNDIEYKYAYANSYFAYTTRGCGMNCSFCAVRTLEPQYIERVCIRKQIKSIRSNDKVNGKKGELKRDLLLLDNNVLRSSKFKQIVDEIIKLGFGKGATCINQRSGKIVNRHIDFNQGLDANLLTQQKADLLGKLAIKPARIAFDHINDKDKYVTAINRCVNAGIREFSNYILYNAEESTGKGHKYPADTPEDLYNRLRISLDLKEILNSTAGPGERVSIYSFPMRYIPLHHKKRGFVNSPQWNKKYLRAIQVMLTPTRGKGVSGLSFFEAAFGENVEEFMKFLLMPEPILAGRGVLKYSSKDSPEQREKKIRHKASQKAMWDEWERLFRKLDNRQYFSQIIASNEFSIKQYQELPDDDYKKIILHYFSPTQFLTLLSQLKNDEDQRLVLNYCTTEFSNFIQHIANHILINHTSYKLLGGYAKVFKQYGVALLICNWIDTKCTDTKGRNDFFLDNLHKLKLFMGFYYVDIEVLKVLKAYCDLDLLSLEQLEEIKQLILTSNYNALRENLRNEFHSFCDKTNSVINAELCLDILEADKIIGDISGILFG